MNPSKLFVLGLLLLTANLSFGALFSPARAGRAEADRLLLLWKMLLLAAIQIGAWAVVLDQGWAAPTLAEAFTRSAACFALIGGSGGGLAAPWDGIAPFIALNGLLFIPVTLLPLLRPPVTELAETSPEPVAIPAFSTTPVYVPAQEPLQPAQAVLPSVLEKAAPITAPAPVALAPTVAPLVPPTPVVTPIAPESGPLPAAPAVPPAPAPAPASHIEPPLPVSPTPQAQETLLVRGGFRPKIPKVTSPGSVLSAEEELAEQLKPIGPTPPPIRFEWKN